MTTQFARASYQEIIDLHTTTDKVSVIGIHTPVTDAPYTFLKGFFDSFQKYHYDGCSLSMVPAARLPADISQVSYEAGDIPIDPRDLLNPILWHGCHGESLGSVLSQFYSAENDTNDMLRDFFDSGEVTQASTSQIGNDAIFESLYYRALTDNTWRKAHPQSGFRIKGLHPLVYSVGTDRQYLPSSSGTLSPLVPHRSNSPLPPSEEGPLGGLGNSGSIGISSGAGLSIQGSEGLENTRVDGSTVYVRNPAIRDVSFFTEKLHGLGWLDTRVRQIRSNGIETEVTGDQQLDRIALGVHYSQIEEEQAINYLPRLFMGICLLPPAYKASQYYRLVLNHSFSFKKFRGLSMDGGQRGRFDAGRAPSYVNML